MMRLTLRAAAALVALALAAAPLHAQALPKAASPEAVGLSSERLARLTRVMKDAVDARQVPAGQRQGHRERGGRESLRHLPDLDRRRAPQRRQGPHRRWHQGELRAPYVDGAMNPEHAHALCAAADVVWAFCQEPALWGPLAGNPALEAAMRQATRRVEDFVRVA